MSWTAEDYRSSQRTSKQKAKHWLDMARRHYDKCEKCAEKRELWGYGNGCDTYHNHLEKADRHQRDADSSGGHAFRLEEASKKQA